MAEYNEIEWGSTVNDYGRLGIYINLSTTATTVTATVEIYIWTKYACSDSNNSLFFDNLSASGSATTSVGSPTVNTTVSSGAGWSTSNIVKLKSYSYSYTRGTSAVTRYLYAKMHSVDRVGGTMYASTTFSVPALASYTVSYNANGGSGAPSSQTKWYGKSLTLSSTKPTRTGYTFAGWATSASGSVAYAAGASYTANATVTLYAKWTAHTYTVKYNANGGTGAPANQTKTYGTALTLSSTKPTRNYYKFLGWATSASATTAQYASGASYTANAAVTLYAVWELDYVAPRIFNLQASRCDEGGNAADDGSCAIVSFEWETDYPNPSINISWVSATGENEEYRQGVSGSSGAFSVLLEDFEFSPETSYTFTVTVYEDWGESEATVTMGGSTFPVDAKAGNDGVAFGKPAELGAAESLGGTGVADFGYDAKFNEPVYGKALGMDRLPAIPANSDFNTYMETGCYAVQSNAIAATCSNIPVDRAGRLEVWSATGEGVRLEQWSYLRQRYIPYNSGNAVWERELTRGENNVWNYYAWWKSSLTPDASEKVYSKAAMSITLSENTVLGAVSTYTKIPFDKVVLSTNSRLTLASNAIRIGSNIQHIKVSGQVLVSPGSTNGLRHIRIQKVSGSTTTSVSWNTLYFTASQHNLHTLTPIIVSVKEGDLLQMVFYTGNASDSISSGSAANGWQTYLTVEEF